VGISKKQKMGGPAAALTDTGIHKAKASASACRMILKSTRKLNDVRAEAGALPVLLRAMEVYQGTQIRKSSPGRANQRTRRRTAGSAESAKIFATARNFLHRLRVQAGISGLQ
jgi:hypothetical protein